MRDSLRFFHRHVFFLDASCLHVPLVPPKDALLGTVIEKAQHENGQVFQQRFRGPAVFGRRQRLLCENNSRCRTELELWLRGKDGKKSKPLAQPYHSLHPYNIAGHFVRPLHSPSQTARQRSKGLAEKIRLGNEEEEKEGGESLPGDQVSFRQLRDLCLQRRCCPCHVDISFAENDPLVLDQEPLRYEPVRQPDFSNVLFQKFQRNIVCSVWKM